MTYSQLNGRANKIAHLLCQRSRGNNPEPIVAVMIDRSPDMVASIFGIMKSGGAYLPLDIKWPKKRIFEILSDSKANTLVISSKFIHIATDLLWELDSLTTIVCTDDIVEDSNNHTLDNIKDVAKMWDYVSDSSGNLSKGAGWINSYTGEPFNQTEVGEMVENVYKKLQTQISPQTRILEIGCGSGLILKRFAPEVGLYVGVDLSERTIEKLRKDNDISSMHNVVLHSVPADEVDLLVEKDFDIVIINSVTQFFSGIYYLDRVLEKSMRVLKDNGILFIGDVRNKKFQNSFYRSLAKYKEVEDVGDFIQRKESLNTELFIPRSYFDNLKDLYGPIEEVQVSQKIGSISNELTEYRFDVLLKINRVKTEIGRSFAKQVFKKCHIEEQPDTNIDNVKMSALNLAYVIYTSGSTGKPKGVMIEHGALLNRLNWMQKSYPLDDKDTLILKTPYTFDVSVWELFWWSLVGARLAIVQQDGERNPEIICDVIRQNRVTVIHFVPSMFRIFLGYIQANKEPLEKVISLKRIFTSGEELKSSDVSLFRKVLGQKNETSLSNLYGPTEATVDVSYFDCLNGHRPIPIGRPIDNTQLYILNEQLDPVNIGEVGELYISGDGIARGYLNNNKLTQEKFIPNPYIKNKRMYKTGDLAKFLSDGNIIYIGRSDFQVKIRGIRIELGEIENNLLDYPGITSAAVLVEEGKTQEIIAYYSSKDKISSEDLRKYLTEKIPAYMIPCAFMYIKDMPINRHGKLDRASLPKREIIRVRNDVLIDNSDVGVALKNIWTRVLQREDISPDSNFFEMGGHSLKVVETVHEISSRLGVNFGIGDFFSTPILKDQIIYIERKSDGLSKSFRIPVSDKSEGFRLSHAQLRLWFLYQMDKSSCAYNILQATMLHGQLNIEILERALNIIINRHEILRTNFRLQENDPVQIVHNSRPLKILRSKIRNSKSIIEEKIVSIWLKPFDLERGQLIRAMVIELGKSKYVVTLVLHHIVCDGWSIDIINKEILNCYDNLIRNPDYQGGPNLDLQVKDCAEWEHGDTYRSIISKQRGYWLKEFADHNYDPVLLPEDEHIEQPTLGVSHIVYRKITSDTEKNIGVICATEEVTPHTVFLAAFYAYLSRISGQNTITLGLPITSRMNGQVKDLIGFFANTIASPFSISNEDKFVNVLRRLKGKLAGIQNNQDYPFDELVREIGESGSFNRNPLFRVAFTEYDLSRDKLILPNTTSDVFRMPICPSMFDLVFSVIDNENKNFEIAVAGDSRFFSRESVERLSENFLVYLSGLVLDIQKKITTPSIISVKESRQLEKFNNAFKQKVHDNLCLHDLLIKSAKKYPKNIAIKFGNKEVTYEDFDIQTSLLATYLQSIGIKKGFLVPVIFTRGIDIFITIYALFKAGAAYIPLDPEYPSDRIQSILESSEAKFVIVGDDVNIDIRSSIEVKRLVFFDIFAASLSLTQKYQRQNSSSKDLAYVIYTSGSTGKPKGVMCSHGGVINSTLFGISYFKLSQKSKVLQVGNITFDTSVWEMNMSIGSGGTLVILPQDCLRDPKKIAALIKKESITFGLFIPTMLAHLDTRNLPLKKLVSGGEVISPVLAEKLMKYNDYYNAYGPTEVSICATVWKHGGKIGKTIPIGKPLPNTQVFILDARREMLPIGCVGEIYISGEGLALGYLNDKEKTEQVFVTDSAGEKILYRTGDLGKWLSDGNLVYVGRIDNQVKIRGYRIELSEIEANILKISGIEQVVVLVKIIDSVDKIVAFCVKKSGAKLNEEGIRTFLLVRLPVYMIPDWFIFIDSIPQKINGKIDGNVLLKMVDHSILQKVGEVRNSAQSDDVELNITNAWKQIGGLQNLEATDNFFEMGGHSILVLKVLFHLKAKYKYSISAQDFYSNPTSRLLAGLIFSKKTKYKIPNNLIVSSKATKHIKSKDVLYKQNGEFLIKDVLVTGGSGYLGAFIIFELLKTTVGIVYVLVRAETIDEARDKVFRNLDYYFHDYDKDRIVAIIGDIEKDNCGFSMEDEIRVFNRVNLIIHAAANTNHIGFEDPFMRTNISGTQNVIDHAYRKKGIRVCVISTLSISGERSAQSKKAFTENDFDVGQQFSSIYDKTKFEAEKIARQAIEDGLDVLIVRLGSLVGSPVQKNPKNNAFYQYLQAIISTHKDWNIEVNIDISPVDISAKGIVYLCKLKNLPIHTFHLFNDHVIKSMEIVKIINNLGWKIDAGSGDDLGYNEQKDSIGLAEYLSNNSDESQYIYDDSITKAIVGDVIQWSMIDETIIGHLLQELKKLKLI
ncbi:MAG: amino acid adenylation domain-containing protein [Candidatus Taylorbacteria bacterium]